MVPFAPELRRAAFQRASDAMERICRSAHGLVMAPRSRAVANLVERIDLTHEVVRGLHSGIRRDIGLGLTLAIALSELVEQVEPELPQPTGLLLMAAAADVLDALSDVAAMGPDRPPFPTAVTQRFDST